MGLGGRNAIITGGAAGLGLAIATAFAREGCSVALLEISATKGAIVSLTRQMAADYSGRGIRVNCICPSVVPGTQMGRTVLATDPDDEARARRLAKYPIGRLAEPEDIAAAAVFLASDEASFVTGVAFAVDGGMTAV